MFTELRNDDDRGQVGIGTLIVFIAMVLVAAIAAGVLINTAGFLQSSAEETGQQSSDQVTNRLEVVSTVGTNIDSSTKEVGTVEITVKKAPGAANIDIGSTIAQWVDSSGSYDLTQGDTANSTNFNVSTVQDDDTSITDSNVLNDPSDRATLQFDSAALDSGGNGLGEGATATIQLNTQSGGTTTVRLVVPETLSGNSAVTL
ncbi:MULTISPECIES: archaellin/type IV pilin N-terminal domain-containing protein [Haloarcula]|uniref:Flagellin n=1 Tax=Haloarcula pellucida TaxID=1427151 RepID=A0A830GS90_9EURY|nr:MULTISPECIES: archaellin/type IV pilin N-terminal domain-containing protein [Halomicroarcula]MBX0349131.1 flagellin [Halomicroarcula pellucida]MDS0279276.1 flagellin [Halomicroarcula sp. S1AR25-4]QIO21628.1 flagellin [Haloarcula sp. JP-L23]GGN99169.1 flagellin [Halomicroarcula pellucida]